MNSAEKKAPEPSMDDIISSIRNIISDEPQESIPVPVDDTPVAVDPPVVQLTENQIAEPVQSASFSDPVVDPALAPAQSQVDQSQVVQAEPVQPQPVEPESVEPQAVVAPQASAPVVAPPQEVTSSLVEPIVGTPLTGAEIASEIAAVPGVMVAGNETPSMESAIVDVPPLAAPIVPEVAPAPTGLADAAAPIETVASINEALVSQPQEQEEKPVRASLETQIDDFPQSSTTQEADRPAVVAVPESLPARVDTIEDLLRGSSAPGFKEIVEPEPVAKIVEPEPVSTDEIVEPLDLQKPDAVEEIAITKPDDLPAPRKATEVAPLVLDASKVTPEDAVAISAVAAATSEALAGTSAPAQPQEGCGSLEDSIKAMLKPMIRDWLDDNMPRILEGAIKEEVKGSGSDES